MNHLHWRVCALICCAATAGYAPTVRAQVDFLSPDNYPKPSKTPAEAALNFYDLLAFVKRETASIERGAANRMRPQEAEPDQDAFKRLLGSIPRAQFGALFAGPNGMQSLPLLAEQATGKSYATQVRGTNAGQTIVSVAPASAPQAREVVVLAQDGGFRVDVKATYGRWNNLSGLQLDQAWLSLTGLHSASDDPFARLRDRDRDNARRASCQSNLKQLALGIEQYKNDYDTKYPGFGQPGNAGWAQNVQPYLKSLQILQCPSEPTGAPDYSQPLPTVLTDKKLCDYFYNASLTDYKENTPLLFNFGRSEAQLEKPTVTILAGDNVPYDANNLLPYYVDGGNNGFACDQRMSVMENDPPAWPGGNCGWPTFSRIPGRRHLEGANYAFADGHVKFYRASSIWGNATSFTVSNNDPTFHPQGG